MIVEILLFFAGVHYMIMLLAASYGFIDLWYRIEEYWLSVSGKVVGLLAGGWLVNSLLPAAGANAFNYGAIAYLVYHIVIFWLGRFLLYLAISSRRESK